MRKSRKEKVQEAYTLLVQGIAEITKTQAWSDFLAFARKFHRYSFRNKLLIYFQEPGATMVAGFRKWNELGRKVKKGEKGIAIFVPYFRKVKVEDEITEILDDLDGKSAKEGYVTKLSGFGIGYVFDVSQTEGKPLPDRAFLEAEEAKATDMAQAREVFDSIVEQSPCPVKLVPRQKEGWHGSFSPAEGIIKLAEEDSLPEKVSTLIHEIGHAYLHKKGALPRNREEWIVEGASYIVCTLLGLKTESHKYILSYGGTEEKMKEVAPLMLDLSEKLLGLCNVAV